MQTIVGAAELESIVALAHNILALPECWFDRRWITNERTLTDMASRMRTPGQHVHLQSVFRPDLADSLHRELDEEAVWEHSLDAHFIGVPPPLRHLDESVCPRVFEWMDVRHPMRFQYSHHNTYSWMTDDPGRDSPLLFALNNFLATEAVRRFLAALVDSPLLELDEQSITGSWYRPPFDHSTTHCDSSKDRRVTFIVHLAKDWRSEYGGQFIWCTPPQIREAEFNTLTLFSPSSITGHFVAPVYVDSPRRLAVSGWFAPAPAEAGGLEEVEEWMNYAKVHRSRIEGVDEWELEHIYGIVDGSDDQEDEEEAQEEDEEEQDDGQSDSPSEENEETENGPLKWKRRLPDDNENNERQEQEL